MPPRHVQGFEPAMIEVMDAMIENMTERSLQFSEQDPQGRKLIQHLPNEMYRWAMESIGTVLFETRLGCLQTPMPPNTQAFIDSIAEMFFTTIPCLAFYNFQKRVGSPYVKRHFAAWDNIFDFVREVVSR
jgi:cholestanetriol 26-monooxygenase